VTGFLVLVVAVTAAIAFGLLRRVRDGRLRDTPASDVVDLRALGVAPGERATIVQFSSAFCAPCRATRRILSDVASVVDGVAYAEVDAETHLDDVRRLRILRTPTTLVLDRSGRVVVRASGQPRKADVIAALARVL
jgi:thiol-disulfide isomerase/thioredoxin